MTEQALEDVPVKHLVVVREDMAAKKSVAEGALESLRDFYVVEQDDYEFAAELLTEVRGNRTLLENERGKATRGLLDTLNVIRGWFKPPIDYWDECEKVLKSKMSQFVQTKLQAQQAALEAAGAASLRGEQANAEAALQVAREAAVQPAAGAAIRTVLRYEVTDASAVPRAFLCVDHAALEAYIGRYGMDTQIAGIRVYQDTEIRGQAVRRK